MKRLANISNDVGIGLIITAVITGSLSIPAIISGWTLPVGMTLSSITLPFPLKAASSSKLSQLFTVKVGKHNSIKFSAQAKSSSIFVGISQAI